MCKGTTCVRVCAQKTRFQWTPRGKSRLIGDLCLKIRQLLRTKGLKIVHIFEMLIEIPIKTIKNPVFKINFTFSKISAISECPIFLLSIMSMWLMNSSDSLQSMRAGTESFKPAFIDQPIKDFKVTITQSTPLSMCSFIGSVTFIHRCWTGHIPLWITSILR